MTDPTEYLRGKMEVRGYTPDVSFLQDGFQRWAESDRPGLSGEMLQGGAKQPRRRRATLRMGKVLEREVEARRGLGMGTGGQAPMPGAPGPLAMAKPVQMGAEGAPAKEQFRGFERRGPPKEGPPVGATMEAFKSGVAEANAAGPVSQMAMPDMSPEEKEKRMKQAEKLEKQVMMLREKLDAEPDEGRKKRIMKRLEKLEAQLAELKGSGIFSALGKLGKSAAKGLKKAASAAKKVVKKVATKENLEKLKKAAKKGAELYVEAERAGVFRGSREERKEAGKRLAAKKFRAKYMPEEEEEEPEMEEEEELEGEGFADLLKKGMELGKKYATKENLEKVKKAAKTAKKAYATAKELGLTTGSTKEKLAKAKALAMAEGKKRATKALKDFDKDGVPDSRDKDDDNDGTPDKQDSNDRGAGRMRRKRAPSKRNMMVAKVMRERGVGLGEASRIVKEEGLA